MAGVRAATPPRGRGEYPQPLELDGTWPQAAQAGCGALCLSPGHPVRLAQQVEIETLDGGDHAGGHARVARCRVELVVTEESLNDAIDPTFEQMGRKTVAQRMQRHRLLIPAASAVS